MKKLLLSFLVTLTLAHVSHGAITVAPLTESQFIDNTNTNLSWVAGGQAGTLSENELGLKATTNYTTFSYTHEYYDSDHTGWNISSVAGFPPVATISTTPFSVAYDGTGNITFSVGPTLGQTSYSPQSMRVSVTEDFNHLGIAIFSEGVFADTHIRLRDMGFDGQGLATLDAWGTPGLSGSKTFDGMSLSGVSNSTSWTLIGTVEFDHEGGFGFPSDDDFQFRVFANEIDPVPEPSSLALIGLTGVLSMFRRKR